MQETAIDFMGIGLKLILSLAVVVGAWIAYSVIRKVARGKIKDKKQMHTVRTLARNALLFACGVIVLLVWLGPGNNLTLAMGILGAGIAFASQEADSSPATGRGILRPFS